MEGLGVHTESDGTTVLTILSDDNFNPVLQRTLLLQFSLERPLVKLKKRRPVCGPRFN
jgi:hypothetical protein